MHEPAPFFADEAPRPLPGRAFWLDAADGVRLRAVLWPAEGEPAGTILLFPGRTEYAEKYGETAAAFGRRGYALFTIDWRGQGLSARLVEDPRKGHIDDFAAYQQDVAAMLAATEALDLPHPRFVLAHSMGGAIALRALQAGQLIGSRSEERQSDERPSGGGPSGGNRTDYEQADRDRPDRERSNGDHPDSIASDGRQPRGIPSSAARQRPVQRPRAVAFSAPMWGIRFPVGLSAGVGMLARGLCAAGLTQVYSPGTGQSTHVLEVGFRRNGLTSDPCVYARLIADVAHAPQLALGGPTLGWLAAAMAECAALAALPSPDIPCLTALAGADRVVSTPAIRRRMARWPGGRLIEVDGARHEIMMETPPRRRAFIEEVCALFAAHGGG